MTAELPALESFADLANPPRTWTQGMEALLAGAIDFDEHTDFVMACESAAVQNGWREQVCAVVYRPGDWLNLEELCDDDRQFLRNMAATADK